MEIESLRDLVVIISGLVVTLVAIIVGVISYLLYSRLHGILESAKTTAVKIESLATVASDEIGKPLIQAAGVVQGVARGINGLRGILKKKRRTKW